MINENEIAKLQTQVEELERVSAEKDNLFAKYEAMVKESKGRVYWMVWNTIIK